MHLNLAQAVDERGQGDPVASYREALRLDPTLTKAYCGLFNTLVFNEAPIRGCNLTDSYCFVGRLPPMK